MNTYSLHKFDSKEKLPFSPSEYSMLKHGSEKIAKKFGCDLADGFYDEHKATLLTSNVVVMESAFAFVRTAACIMTKHFIRRLNYLITNANGKNVEYMKINRTVPYISDYGKLGMDARMELLKKDTFSFDNEFIKDKFLVFTDDVYITGTHHMKIEDMLKFYQVPTHKAIGVYFSELTSKNVDPSIESYLNNYLIKDLPSLQMLIKSEPHYKIVVRTLKLILSTENEVELNNFLKSLDSYVLEEMYYNCLGEGYYKNPTYSKNFAILKSYV
jgi:hypothetical protein